MCSSCARVQSGERAEKGSLGSYPIMFEAKLEINRYL